MPPNQDSFDQHVKRASFQAHIWRNACEALLDLPDITEYGWDVGEDERVTIKWMTLPPAPDSVLEFVNCKCTKGCENRRCSCVKGNLKCTDACKCTDCKNGRPGENDDTDDEYDILESDVSDDCD